MSAVPVEEIARLMLSSTNNLTLHTGNIINWNHLKRKTSQNAGEEVLECLSATLNVWSSTVDPSWMNEESNNALVVTNPNQMERITEDERSKLKVSVKIFLLKWDPDLVVEAVDQVCNELDIGVVDSVLLALPPLEAEMGEELTVNHILPMWEPMERLYDVERVSAIGTSDLDKEMLEQTHGMARVKPTINQVNVVSCCVIPPELTAFAKENDIQLLTHSDPRDVLPTPTFQEILRGSSHDDHVDEWQPFWVLRYTVMVKCRGVIKAKGYIVNGRRHATDMPLSVA
ncbi:PREDICTED: glutamate--cysteine ligase regulatory subunit-like [Branchiostoma belcheri]|uniref:Glutamate--cysteine ligase regulatory subunit n=1 Tax=Branchiostoma belcheri TaxID=7741 RepID=A0A6P4YBH7_BRABE|nr:PREDICTED: glutamate--cysteine ligase regulatory subunit-like [Branchiostoma belcheri]KAI8508779.1 hypothetical protein Bbelb_138780 [Branchiostoma belcheri]